MSPAPAHPSPPQDSADLPREASQGGSRQCHLLEPSHLPVHPFPKLSLVWPRPSFSGQSSSLPTDPQPFSTQPPGLWGKCSRCRDPHWLTIGPRTSQTWPPTCPAVSLLPLSALLTRLGCYLRGLDGLRPRTCPRLLNVSPHRVSFLLPQGAPGCSSAAASGPLTAALTPTEGPQTPLVLCVALELAPTCWLVPTGGSWVGPAWTWRAGAEAGGGSSPPPGSPRHKPHPVLLPCLLPGKPPPLHSSWALASGWPPGSAHPHESPPTLCTTSWGDWSLDWRC